MKYLYSALFIITTSLAFSAQAAKLCVQVDGGKCYDSIQDAVDDAGPGDTIIIGAGTFFESVYIPETKGGLKLIGKKGSIIDSWGIYEDTLDIDAQGVSVSTLAIRNTFDSYDSINIDADNVTIKGVDIRRSTGDCIRIDEAENVTIESSLLRFCDEDGINADYSHNLKILKSFISNTGDDGLSIDNSDNVLIQNTRIVRTQEDCIDMDDNDSSDSVITVEKNRAIHCGNEAIEVDGENIVVKDNLTGHSEDDNIDVLCHECSESVVSGNVGMGTADGDSCFDIEFDGDGLLIEDNVARNCSEEGFNIDPYEGGDHMVQIFKNRAFDSGSENNEGGFEIDAGDDSEVEGNISNRNFGEGFLLQDGNYSVMKNTAMRNGEGGFRIYGGGHNLVKNKAIENIGEGFAVQSDNNTLTKNVAKGNRQGFDICDTGVNNAYNKNKHSGEIAEECMEGE